MKYKKYDIIRHKYDEARFKYFGCGVITDIANDEVSISFTKGKNQIYSYSKKYLYQFKIITSIFREDDDDTKA